MSPYGAVTNATMYIGASPAGCSVRSSSIEIKSSPGTSCSATERGTGTTAAKVAALKNGTVSLTKKAGAKPKPKMSFNDMMRAGAGAKYKGTVRIVKGSGPKDKNNPYNNPFIKRRAAEEANGTEEKMAIKPVKKAAGVEKLAAAKRASKKRGSDDEEVAPAPITKKRRLVSRREMMRDEIEKEVVDLL